MTLRITEFLKRFYNPQQLFQAAVETFEIQLSDCFAVTKRE